MFIPIGDAPNPRGTPFVTWALIALELSPRPETAAAVRQLLAEIDALQKRRVGRLHSPPGWS